MALKWTYHGIQPTKKSLGLKQKKIHWALLLGAAVGALTVAGKFLPPDWNALADSAALWMAAAFFTAALGQRPRQSAGLAITVLVVANTVYYPLTAWVQQKPMVFTFAVVVWYGGALAAGMVFGTGGYLWRRKEGWPGALGAALPAAALWAESAMMLTTDYYAGRPAAPLAGFGLGLAVLLFCIFGTKREKGALAHLGRTLVCVAALTAAGVLGYRLLWWLLG